MSIQIIKEQNQCYSLEVNRFYGGEKRGMMFSFTIDDGGEWISIALNKEQAKRICERILESLEI